MKEGRTEVRRNRRSAGREKREARKNIRRKGELKPIGREKKKCARGRRGTSENGEEEGREGWGEGSGGEVFPKAGEWR